MTKRCPLTCQTKICHYLPLAKPHSLPDSPKVFEQVWAGWPKFKVWPYQKDAPWFSKQKYAITRPQQWQKYVIFRTLQRPHVYLMPLPSNYARAAIGQLKGHLLVGSYFEFGPTCSNRLKGFGCLAGKRAWQMAGNGIFLFPGESFGRVRFLIWADLLKHFWLSGREGGMAKGGDLFGKSRGIFW